jgi:hypothetical protein
VRVALASAVSALAAGAIAAGCGGDDNSDAISKSEFLAKGNQICKQGNAVEGAAFSEFKGRPTEAQIAAVITGTILPNIQRQIDQIGALGTPDGDEDEVNGMLDDAQTALEQERADPAAVASGNSPDPFADVARRLHAYGLTECAQDTE